MEAHFVHAAESGGGLAVVGAFIEPGRHNAVFNKIVSTMPATEGPPVVADRSIDPNGLLPLMCLGFFLGLLFLIWITLPDFIRKPIKWVFKRKGHK